MFNAIYVLLSFGLLATYFLFYRFLDRGWKNIDQWKLKRNGETKQKSFSIVVPFRNELDQIAGFLDCFENQTYSKELFELILINDHSDDGTEKYIASYQNESELIMRCLDMPQELQSKKKALAYGIEHANASYIIQTDMDTWREPNWMANIAQYTSMYEPDLSILPVSIKLTGSAFLNVFQSLEFDILQYIGLSYAGNGMPILCNGANLLFKKGIFNEEDAFATNYHIQSGDDLAILESIKLKGDANITTSNETGLLVSTYPEKKLVGLMQQKARWAGKVRFMKSPPLLFLGFLSLASWLYCPVALLLEYYLMESIFIALIFILGKFILDIIMIRSFRKAMGQDMPYISALFAFVLYPFYYFPVLILATFGAKKWKGRKIRQ